LPTSPVEALLLQDPTSPASEATSLGETVFSFAAEYGISQFAVVNTLYTVGVLLVLLVVYLLLERAGKSPYGRVLKAIREDETAAQSLGKDTQNFKVRAFALGCGLMGLAGIVWFAMGPRASVTPQTFRPNITFYIFIALIIGGAGSNTGSVLGGALFASLLFEAPPMIRSIIQETFQVDANPGNLIEALIPIASGNLAPLGGFLLNNIDSLRFIGMGILLVVLIQRKPDGLLGARKETAAGVPLTADTRPDTGRADADAAAADGGETDE
jgi:branched-chain amino acid transport system permease protein